MAKFDDPEDLESSDEAGDSRPQAFDPLFGWPLDRPESPEPETPDDTFGYMEPRVYDDDFYTFNSYDAEAAAYPSRHQRQYEQRLTELQRRLRAETIVVPHERRWVVTIRELAETLLLAALIFLAVRASFQNFRVEGASMQPSLEHGEYLIVNKLSYAELDTGFLDWLPFYDSGDNPMHNIWGEPERGDIIVFVAPTSPNRDFIKRIIGLPGDTVEIYPGLAEVHVNGQTLQEDYIQGVTQCQQTCVFDIPEAGSEEAFDKCGSAKCYFVMGDNRQNSSDSRQDWLVPEENIIGKALITYWHDGGPNIDLAPNHGVTYADDNDEGSE